MIRDFKVLAAGALLLLLAACAQGKTPLDDAYALNGEYQAIAHAELAFMRSPLGDDECVKSRIKAADRVAYSYVEKVTESSLAWSAAPSEQKPRELTLFDRLLLLGKGALGDVQAAMKPCEEN
jgi:hypothetical protein